MDLARYVVEAVVLEGRSYREVARAHRHTPVILLVADLDVRVITDEGEVLRHLTLDPTRDYQSIGGSEVSTMS